MQIARVPLCLFRACTLTHNTAVLAPSPRSISRAPSLPLLPPRRVALPMPRVWKAWYTQNAALRSYGKRIATAWHGTIISVDYAIITRPGGGHLMALTRLREGLPEPTPKGYAGPLPPRREGLRISDGSPHASAHPRQMPQLFTVSALAPHGSYAIHP